jgi:hypothetical protein
MCTIWGRRLQRVARHLARNLDLAIVAAADPPALRAHARRRGWHLLRLLGAGSGMSRPHATKRPRGLVFGSRLSAPDLQVLAGALFMKDHVI